VLIIVCYVLSYACACVPKTLYKSTVAVCQQLQKSMLLLLFIKNVVQWAEKSHDAVVKFDTYRNLQRHRAVLPAIARHLDL